MDAAHNWELASLGLDRLTYNPSGPVADRARDD